MLRRIGPEVSVSMKRFKLLPFKDNVYVIFTPDDLKKVRDIYAASSDYRGDIHKLDNVNSNYAYVVLTEPGTACAHFVYLPICARQGPATPWNPMNPVLARFATEIVLNCCRAVGYNPMNEHTMFIQQVARVQQRITEIIAEYFNARLVMSSWSASYLDTNLNERQWEYINAIKANTLADLARQQCMIEESGVVDLGNDGHWQSTTYFY